MQYLPPMQTNMTPEQGSIFDSIYKGEENRVSTENLIYYNNLKEKEDLFITETIESTTRFFDFIERRLPNLLKGKTPIFRGLSHAKYRLFTKAQRAYRDNSTNDIKDNGAYHSLIANMIQTAKSTSRSALQGFFESFGVDANDMAVLSFLQHYGAPTPFMDWTTNEFIALYFAVSGLSRNDINSYHNKPGYEIDNYFSLYILLEEQVLNQVHTFKALSTSSKSALTYITLQKKHFAYIKEKYNGIKPSFHLSNNLHIVNQKGLFVFNNSSYLPLEEVFFSHWKFYYAGNRTFGRQTSRTPLVCININKSIAIHIKEDLRRRGYTKSTIFPKGEYIAKAATPRKLKFPSY